MKFDARSVLNKKKWKNATPNPRFKRNSSGGPIDARKILNIKRSTVQNKSRQRFSRNPQHSTSNLQRSISGQGFTRTTQKQFNTRNPNFRILSDKKVKLSRDGNLLITSRSGNPGNTSHGWKPADIDMEDLEHISIQDVLDVDSLPSAVAGLFGDIGLSRRPQTRSEPVALFDFSKPIHPDWMQILSPIRQIGHSPDNQHNNRSNASLVTSMPITMVADQVISAANSAKVHVSNLQVSVTQEDIMELFGDIGLVRSVEMSQPGSATIEYFDYSDATKACNSYHNRLLDGQPMRCYLENNLNSSRIPVSQRLGQRTHVSPVQSTSFSAVNPRMRHNPRDVHFTVKLS